MHKYKKTISSIVGFILTLLFCYIVYLFLLSASDALTSLKPEVLAAIIGAMATVFVGIAAVIISNKQSKQRDIDESHRAKKVEIYNSFLEVVSGVMSRENKEVSKEGISDQALIDFMVDFKTQLLLWGSPKVIKLQLEFQRVSEEGGDIFTAVNNLYKAIREDIGLSNRGLNNHELVKMYLKNPAELDDLLAEQKRAE